MLFVTSLIDLYFFLLLLLMSFLAFASFSPLNLDQINISYSLSFEHNQNYLKRLSLIFSSIKAILIFKKNSRFQSYISVYFHLSILTFLTWYTKFKIWWFLKTKTKIKLWYNFNCDYLQYVSVGSTFGRFFTVGVNEPKPNGPDTINLVEKMGSRTGL